LKYQQAKDPYIIYFIYKHNDNLKTEETRKTTEERKLSASLPYFILSQGSFLFFSFSFPFFDIFLLGCWA